MASSPRFSVSGVDAGRPGETYIIGCWLPARAFRPGIPA